MKTKVIVVILALVIGAWVIVGALDSPSTGSPPLELTVDVVDPRPEEPDLTDARFSKKVVELASPEDVEETYERLLESPQDIEALLYGLASGLEGFTQEQLKNLCLVAAEHRVFSRREMTREQMVEGLTRLQAIERYPSRLGIELSEMEQETVDKIVESHLPAIEQLAESVFDMTTECAKRSWELGEFAFYKDGDEVVEPPIPHHPGAIGFEVGGGVRGYIYHFRFTSQGYPDLEAENARLKQRKLAASQEVYAYLKSL